MDDEMDTYIKTSTWELIELPADHKAINSKWVFKVKDGVDGRAQ